MTSPRVARARQTEATVAEWFRQHGWPNAKRIPASLPGRDILGMPEYAIEVKARRDLNLPAWLQQAEYRGEGLPMVIHRPDGYGPKAVNLWPVTMRLEHVTPLLRHWSFCDCDESCNHA